MGYGGGGGGLTFAGSGCGGGCDQNQIYSRRECCVGKKVQLQFGAVTADGFEIGFREFKFTSDGLNGQQRMGHRETHQFNCCAENKTTQIIAGIAVIARNRRDRKDSLRGAGGAGLWIGDWELSNLV